MKEFKDTFNLFSEAIGLTFPINYTTWMSIPNRLKAAALFVNFYDQITLAWTKACSEFTDDEDGVSTVMQYLMKNVPIIMDNPKKFAPAYIYRVAYNCMGCLRRVQREQDRYAYTVSQFTVVNDDVLDLFDTIIGSDCFTASELEKLRMEMRNIILNMDKDTIKVVEHLLDGKKLTKKAAAKEPEIMADLRKTFAKYRSTLIPEDNRFATFKDVLDCEDIIDSATVEMRDGVKAVYCGEKRISPITGKTEVVFFGPDRDYVLPVGIAGELVVTEVEMIGE